MQNLVSPIYNDIYWEVIYTLSLSTLDSIIYMNKISVNKIQYSGIGT